MVSNYKRKTDKGSYSKEKLVEAAQAVRNGHLSGYKAAQIYNIPRMTIMDHVKNKRFKSNSLGRNTALTYEIETKLASSIHTMEKYGFGLTKKEVLEMVGQYVNRNHISTPFKNGTPGQAWFTAFKQRHHLSVKKPQAVEYARKRAIDPFIVYSYFELLNNTLKELNLLDKPYAIWNLDETSFSNDPEKSKIVGVKGHAATRVISSPGRENTTVLLGASALGEKTPPLIIYKGKNVWDEWTSPDAYPGTSYAATKKGWMETEIFEKFFKKVFLPAVGAQRPILLIYDGHATHVGLNIIEEARKADITILKLPPHTSHVLQPLDVAVMKAFKDRWDPLLVKWQRSNVGVKLPKKEFARLIGVVWAQIDGQVLRNGFRKTGIYPFNSEEIKESLFDPLKLRRWKEFQVLKSQERHEYDHDIPERLVCYNDESLYVDLATKNEPQSLLSLALNCIIRVVGTHSNHSNQHCSANCKTDNRIQNDDLETRDAKSLKGEESHQKLEEESFVSNKDLKRVDSSSHKIQILENRLITFEELLLMQVKAGSNEKCKRQKIAPGAEVITHDDVVKRKMEEKIKHIKKEPQTKKNMTRKQPKTKNLNQKEQKKPQRKVPSNETTPDITSDDDAEVTPQPDPSFYGPSTSTGKTGMKKKTKRNRLPSIDSITSISDIMSVYSDTNISVTTLFDDFDDEANYIAQNKIMNRESSSNNDILHHNNKDKHKKIAPENRKKQPQTKKNTTRKQPKTKNLNQKEQKKPQRKVPSNETTPDITGDDDAEVTPQPDPSFYGPSTSTGKTGMKKKTKRNRLPSIDSITSISDIMSVYSDTNISVTTLFDDFDDEANYIAQNKIMNRESSSNNDILHHNNKDKHKKIAPENRKKQPQTKKNTTMRKKLPKMTNLNKKGKKKTQRKTSSNETTPDVTSDVDFTTTLSDPEIDKENSVPAFHADMTSKQDTLLSGPTTSTGKTSSRRNAKRSCLSPIDFTTVVSDKMNILSDTNLSIRSLNDDNFDAEVNCTAKDNIVDQDNPSDNDILQHTYSINDFVLVKYHTRQKWNYYIGLIENIKVVDEETYYCIDFLKTVRKPQLVFRMTKRKDRDDVPALSIIKKIEIKTDTAKQYYLCNIEDAAYFINK